MSEDLIPLYREMASHGEQFRGLSVLQHKEQIKKLAKEHGVRTLLDYGCGAGDAYRSPHAVWHEWGLKRHAVQLYDPAFPLYDRLPANRRFDMVVCSDVLEHVPEDKVDDFVKTLFRHAKKVVWASVCCRPAKKFFPNTGVNLHVTIRDHDWWAARFTAASYNVGGRPWILVETA